MSDETIEVEQSELESIADDLHQLQIKLYRNPFLSDELASSVESAEWRVNDLIPISNEVVYDG